jgi:hypothetical protein
VGTEPTKRLWIATPKDSATCGFDFEIGEKYLVYSSWNSEIGERQTGLCSGTQKYTEGYEVSSWWDSKELGDKMRLLEEDRIRREKSVQEDDGGNGIFVPIDPYKIKCIELNGEYNSENNNCEFGGGATICDATELLETGKCQVDDEEEFDAAGAGWVMVEKVVDNIRNIFKGGSSINDEKIKNGEYVDDEGNLFVNSVGLVFLIGLGILVCKTGIAVYKIIRKKKAIK